MPRIGCDRFHLSESSGGASMQRQKRRLTQGFCVRAALQGSGGHAGRLEGRNESMGSHDRGNLAGAAIASARIAQLLHLIAGCARSHPTAIPNLTPVPTIERQSLSFSKEQRNSSCRHPEFSRRGNRLGVPGILQPEHASLAETAGTTSLTLRVAGVCERFGLAQCGHGPHPRATP